VVEGRGRVHQLQTVVRGAFLLAVVVLQAKLARRASSTP
jgi:hypothetical protein